MSVWKSDETLHLMFDILLQQADFSLENDKFFPIATVVSVFGKFWRGIAVFSLYHVRYCGIRTSPPFTKRSSELKFGGIFFKHYWLSLLSQKVCCLLSSAVLLLIKVHFFEEQVIGLHVLQKDHDLFLPFLHTMSATDDTWNMSAFMLFVCLFVCMFFFYLLSSYKRAEGSIKLVWDWKWFGTTRQSQAKKKQTISFSKIWG